MRLFVCALALLASAALVSAFSTPAAADGGIYGNGQAICSPYVASPFIGAGGYGAGFNAGYGGFSQFPAGQGTTTFGYGAGGYGAQQFGGYGGGFGGVAGYSQFVDGYSTVDLGQLFTFSKALAGDANAYATRANSDYNAAIRAYSDGQQRIAETRVRGQVVAQAFQATAQALSTTAPLALPPQSTGPATAPPAGFPASPAQPAGPGATVTPGLPPQSSYTAPGFPTDAGHNIQSIVQAKCISCHGAQPIGTALSLVSLDSLTPDQVRGIRTRIMSNDPEVRMPKGAGAQPLDDDEKIAVIEALKGR